MATPWPEMTNKSASVTTSNLVNFRAWATQTPQRKLDQSREMPEVATIERKKEYLAKIRCLVRCYSNYMIGVF